MGGIQLAQGAEDLVKRSVLDNFQLNGELEIWEVALTVGIAFAVGLFIYLIYRITFDGVIYDKGFGTSLIMLAMVTSMVILPISTNLIVALGMVGALSIVRFRTAVKDPKDTIYMFWAIAAGISLGARIYLVALLGSLVIGLLLVLWNLFRTKKNLPYILVVRFDEASKREVQTILRKLPQGKLKSKIVSQGTIELTIEMNIKPAEIGIVDAFGNIPGVHDASLISYKGDVVS